MHRNPDNSGNCVPGRARRCGRCAYIEPKNEENKFRYTPRPGWRNDLVSEFADQGPRDPGCHPLLAMTGPMSVRQSPYTISVFGA
jgi:hypothetical protein